ncbi:MAG: hypothetical protein A2231_02360 [Candidatus Firestonebacteria bacterium RIFOXYA2_FULL_40_8]|nr:MAG: hypothetical protein A2231_02360 [Candidatus Firestonebacteria bacterium RIFOXYA2_FULL_40_8]
MKILFIQPTMDKRGHYGVYTSNLCQELGKISELTLFTNKSVVSKYISETPSFEIVEYKNGKYGFEKFDEKKNKIPFYYTFGYLRNSFIIIRAALKYIRKNKYDLIQIFDTEYSILSLLLLFYGSSSSKVVVHISAPNFAYNEYNGPFILKLYKMLQRNILAYCIKKRVNGINSLGEYHREMLIKQLEIPESIAMGVIYDGADFQKIEYTQEIARNKLNIDYKGFVFLFFGILRRDKGIEYLLEAVSIIKDLDFKIIIAGALFDYKEAELQALISKYGIKDKLIVKFEYIKDEEIPYYFFSADVVVFPYIKKYRGGSGPLLKQAAIYKKPVLVTAVSEMGRLVKSRNMGIVVTSENVTALADAMKGYMQIPREKRQQYGENASKTANTWKSMAQKYLNYFEIVVK